MSLTLVPEDDLRAVLRTYRADPSSFESAVRNRIKAAASHSYAPLASLSPALRSAAAFLPLEIISGGKIASSAVKLAPAVGIYKVLSYAALPAISLFVLLGATVFSVVRIRFLRAENSSAHVEQRVLADSIKQWWRDHWRGAGLVYAATLAMSWIGASWLLFLGYIISAVILILVLNSLAKAGLGNRLMVGQSCVLGLGFLGQVAAFPGIGDQDIHLLDQIVIAPLFFCGVFVVALIWAGSLIGSSRHTRAGIHTRALVAWLGLLAGIVIPLTVWFMRPILRPATPTRIKAYVESFDKAPFSSSSWRQWEIVAGWAIESKLDPNLAGPRQLLASEIAGEQNPFTLGSAFRVGLVRPDQIDQMRDYDQQRKYLLQDLSPLVATQPITSLEQVDWVIRAAVMRNDLTAEARDFLEQRLHASLEAVWTDPYAVLETPLRATQLLEVIGRPVDTKKYRDQIHNLLRRFHSTTGGGFQVAGGFKVYDQDGSAVGSLEATSYAVELMGFYGIPGDLDLNWVRSFLRPLFIRRSPQNWMAAVTLDRLNRLPGVTHPTWLETMYYERSLLAAAVLVGLCIFATLSSPMPRPGDATEN